MAFPDPPEQERAEHTAEEVRAGWIQRRREKAVAEILRNRRGDYRVPTWALALALVLVLAAWTAFVALS